MLKDIYSVNIEFTEVWEHCQKKSYKLYHHSDGYLFSGNRLCIPMCSLWIVIIHEYHDKGLARHFERKKNF